MFGLGRPAPSPSDASAIGLAELVSAVAAAVFRSTDPLRKQHIHATAEFFEPADPGDDDAVAGLKPRVLSMHIPRHSTAADQKDAPSAVPLASLVQNNPIVLDEAALELRCRMTGFDRIDGQDANLQISLALEGVGAPMTLSLKY